MKKTATLILAMLLICCHHISLLANTPPTVGTDKAPVIAMLSLIGDRLNVVTAQFETGTNISPNRRDYISIDTPVFDQLAMNAVIKGLRKTMPTAEFAVLNARSPVLFEKQHTLFDRNGDSMKMPGAIIDAAKQQGANRLLLILKRRDDTGFAYSSGFSAGKGKLEGLGFYMDASVDTSTTNDEGKRVASGRGFVGPYVYLDMFLIDLGNNRIISEQALTTAKMIASGHSEGDPKYSWNAMSSADRVRHISDLIETKVSISAERLAPKQ